MRVLEIPIKHVCDCWWWLTDWASKFEGGGGKRQWPWHQLMVVVGDYDCYCATDSVSSASPHPLPLLLLLLWWHGIGELSRSTTRHTVAMNSHCGRLNNCSHGWYNKNMKMLVMSGCTEEMFAMSRGKSECLPCAKQSIGIYSISSWSLDWCLPFILCLSADLMVSINGNVGNEKILICSCPCPFPW